MAVTRLRVAAVQYGLQRIASFDQFADQVTHHVKTAAEFSSKILVFPEFVTTQLLSIGTNESSRAITSLPSWTSRYEELFLGLAKQHEMAILAGTHVVETPAGGLANVAHLFFPDQAILRQPKLHLTPTEVKDWHLRPGNDITLFDLPGTKRKAAILTCYDVEFPEIVRVARARGADVILCPSCTDDRHGFFRVRYCCHARTIENQLYVINAPTVGSLPNVDWMRANFGQAAILSPCDVPFPPAGIIAEGDINMEMIIVGDLDFSLLDDVRLAGSVTTWRDRRTDLYGDWR